VTQPTGPLSQQPQSLPDGARARLDHARAGGAFFTDSLSADEFLLAADTGFTPLGIVMGSCVYHVGLQTRGWNVSQELTVLSQSMYAARGLAMARMESEADLLGADGVIGVSVSGHPFEFGGDVREFVAVGTAVRATGKVMGALGDGVSVRTAAGRPFTSNLAGDAFWKLWQAGWLPRAMVIGVCVYHLAHLTLRQTLQTFGQNTELLPFTQATYDAREIATSRMQWEAQQVGADGVTSVGVRVGNWGWGEHAVEYLAVGTAISRARPDAVPRPPQPTISFG
jgi:uncharacterized protein YbjQ (UPF0145 family)